MNSKGMYWLAGVVFALTLASVVTLRLAGEPVDDVITLAGPILTGLFIVGILGRQVEETKGKVEETARRVETVERNTNGLLTRHVDEVAESAATSALAKVGVNSESAGGRHGAP